MGVDGAMDTSGREASDHTDRRLPGVLLLDEDATAVTDLQVEELHELGVHGEHSFLGGVPNVGPVPFDALTVIPVLLGTEAVTEHVDLFPLILSELASKLSGEVHVGRDETHL